MELTNEFHVAVPVDRAWAVLTDVERIAPCMPGAQLQEVEGDEYRGIVKVKVGPISAQYKGKATFTERDAAAHRAVLLAEGRETRGQGNATATITATLEPEDGGTRVHVVTDLAVTGKVAQFGRGVLADVSAKLLDQFVACLETDVLAAEPATGGATAPATAPAAGEHANGDDRAPVAVSSEPAEGNGSRAPAAGELRRIESKPVEAVDLLQTAGAPVAKRMIPLLVAGLLALLLLRRRRRHRV
jgi:carbon monoxide dehydrogenase subunit G